MAPQTRLRAPATTHSASLVWLAATAASAALVLYPAPAGGQAYGSWGQAYQQATPSWGPGPGPRQQQPPPAQQQAPQAPQAPQGAHQGASRCTTPRLQPGHCIRLVNCKILLDLLRSAQISTRSQPDREVTDFLRRSFCGFEGSSVRVTFRDHSEGARGERWGMTDRETHPALRRVPRSAAPDPSAAQPPAESAPAAAEPPLLVSPLSGPERPNRRPARPGGSSSSRPGNANGDVMLPTSPPTDAPYEFPPGPAAGGGGGGGGGDGGSAGYHGPPPPAYSTTPAPHEGVQPAAYPQPDSFANGEDLALSLGSGSDPEPPPAQQPDYPVENLALLPIEVCGLSMHREQHADQQVTNRTGLMRYPWMARLGYKKERERIEFLCTGSLISERYVLTAAHCLGKLNGPVTVRLGEWDTNTEPDCVAGVCSPKVLDVAVEKRIEHEDFRNGINDIALLRLSKPVPFSESVRPICLPVSVHNSPEEDLIGKSMLVASWGNTSPIRRQHAPSRWLLNYHVYVDAPRECGAGYDAVDDVAFDRERQLCVGGGGCHGDSGSPLMVSKQFESLADYEDMVALERDVLHGVLSFGVPDCAVRGAPLVFTRVSSYVPWVIRHLEPNPFVPKEELANGSGSLNPRIADVARPKGKSKSG
ncbi:Serine protease easter [Frankliniella fusca]|uniref:Serine protease easter n=1 Tax=Frankliniella fusca TaxID=407009 RepID=A0AAE1GUN7_9NEOP|nr:Serine protease easter [Frankliniella fusca]